MSLLDFYTVAVLLVVLAAIVAPLVSKASSKANRHKIGETDSVQ